MGPAGCIDPIRHLPLFSGVLVDREREKPQAQSVSNAANEPDAERREEDRRLRVLRRAVDYALWIIARTEISLGEAQKLVAGVREQALILFPGKETTYDLIYAPRFRRAIAERFRLQ
jgi:hypothetical protein